MSPPKKPLPPLPAAAPAAAVPAAAVRTDASRRSGLLGRLARKTRATAELVFPAVPSLVDHHVEVLADHFAALGRPFSQEDLASLRRLLLEKTLEGWRTSAYSNIFVRYDAVRDGTLRVDYSVAVATSSLDEEYRYWVDTREPPLFGKHPDARLLAALSDLQVPPSSRCLDVGAGTGRNTLPLARRGLEVFAVEPAPALADVLEAQITSESLRAHVVRADVLAGPLPVPPGSFAFALASQVTSHFRSPADLHALLAAFAAALSPGGYALITAFLPAADYRPDRVAREMAQACWSTFFTREELATALDGLPLSLVSDEDALSFERTNTPAADWPPTGWYEEWARGEDVFGHQPSPPISLRWLLLRRAAAAPSHRPASAPSAPAPR